ncbi:MAG TPA: tRNA (adenosine(37)-N6)-threonylcarbamoyltransferase complex dimerization subunit type 1 TsaB, partial [Candidatus Binatia bacterium]|nr:tRNA (adenosine(37)-N6)-threonylcarbamoyltransferase complex dimerization subunit type 1 TsaB [Candidatus Binatia bacterium]
YPRRGIAEGSGAKSNHAEIIVPLVDSVLRRAGSELSAVAGIAVSIGPGSFTGVRIGLSTVKGLAYGTGVPAVGISTLQAIAARVPLSREGCVPFWMPVRVRFTPHYFVNTGNNLSV